jgi:hypothetical protein
MMVMIPCTDFSLTNDGRIALIIVSGRESDDGRCSSSATTNNYGQHPSY